MNEPAVHSTQAPRPTGTADGRAAHSDIQDLLLGIVGDVLGETQIGVDDSFFELGGDSITSIELVSRARKAGLRLEYQHVFEGETVAAMAEAVAGAEPGAEAGTEAGAQAESRPVSGGGALVELDAEARAEVDAAFAGAGPLDGIWPLTALQEGLLFHALYDQDKADPYLVQAPVMLTEAVDTERLRAAFDLLLGRHESLRAGFLLRRSGEPVQVIPAEVTLPWREIDLSGVPEQELRHRITDLLDADRSVRFDPVAPPLMRVTLVKLATDRSLMVLTSHHILWDGWSMAQSLTEVFELYATGGDTDHLPPAVPFRDYLTWLTEQDEDAGLAAWAQEL
uniref:condensation domain-containing protein n=1 Tax=Streptomyces sp. KLOTTS4A1 TaxID=3390996 RepID=UPI0039F5D8BD